MKTYDVIVIGAGISGLYATKMLTEKGKSVLLVEARDRVGGRLRTREIYDGVTVDLGGQWIGPTQDNMYEILKEYDTEFIPSYFEGKSILSIGGKNKKYKGIIPPLPVHHLLNMHFTLKKLTRLSETVNLDEPWKTPNAKALDRITLYDWVRKHIYFDKAFKVIKIGVETVFATSMADISFLHALIYAKSGNDIECLINIEGGAQQDKILGGVQPLLEKMAQPFWENILFDCPVNRINQEGGEVEIETDKGTFKSKKVIVTVPPAALENIRFEPELPTNKKQMISRWFNGSAIKVFAIYDKPFWRENGYNGMVASDSSYVAVTFDNTSPKDDRGILVGFVVGDEAKEFVNFSDEKRAQIVKQELVGLFGDQAKNPLHVHTEAWTKERWTNGCYAGMLPTNVWSTIGKSWRDPYLNVHWAGTETSERWMGYMEGGVISAKRVVKEVL